MLFLFHSKSFFTHKQCEAIRVVKKSRRGSKVINNCYTDSNIFTLVFMKKRGIGVMGISNVSVLFLTSVQIRKTSNCLQDKRVYD